MNNNTIPFYGQGHDLVARVANTSSPGWMYYDTDLTYMLYAEGGALASFEGRESELTEEEVRLAYCQEEGDELIFARWEAPGEWSML